MSTSREKLQQARELIQQQRYDEARAILRTVDHDMALDMIDEINKLSPAAKGDNIKSNPSVIDQLPMDLPTPKKGGGIRTILLVVCGGVLLACVLCVGLVIITPKAVTPTPGQIAAQPTAASLSLGQNTIDTITPTRSTALSRTSTPTSTPTANAQSLSLGSNATATSTKTSTPLPPSATLAPMDQLKSIVAGITLKDVSQIEIDNLDKDLITFKYPLNDLSTDFAKLDAKVTMPKIMCALKDFPIKPAKYIIYGTIPVVDAYGNQSVGNGVIMTVTATTLGKFNCSDSDLINIETAADSYTIMPVLQ